MQLYTIQTVMLQINFFTVGYVLCVTSCHMSVFNVLKVFELL